jgi:uncharacterized Zn-finger protein
MQWFLNRLGFEENLVFEQGRVEYLKKPYACSLCNRRYNYEKGLLSHCKENHNGLGIEKDNNEPLACSVCVISQQVFLQLFLIIFQFILTTISHRLE